MNLRRAFFIAFLIVQILVPLAQVYRPKPARFAWQMFSGTQAPTRVKIKTGDELRDVDVVSMVGNWRGDLNFARHLPPFLCRRFPQASSIFLFYVEAQEPQEFRCTR